MAGIRRVLELQKETSRLQAELAALRELAGQQPADRARHRQGRARRAGSGAVALALAGWPLPRWSWSRPSRSCRRAVRARSAARSSSSARIRSAATRV